MLEYLKVLSRIKELEGGLVRILDHSYYQDLAKLDVAEEFLKSNTKWFILSIDGAYAAHCNHDVSTLYYKYGYICARPDPTERDLVMRLRATELRDKFDEFYDDLRRKEGNK